MGVHHNLPMVLAEVSVSQVERLSPTYLRVELAGDDLADFGVRGPLFDQRIALIFPNAAGGLPSFKDAGEDWYERWIDSPEDERGSMRTYTVREVRDTADGRRVVVDFVLHLAPGSSGPASRWAARAHVGDRLVICGPKQGEDHGGIEFSHGDATRMVLAGDETAVPAVSAILASLPSDAIGAAFLEVPLTADILPVDGPPGVPITWLPRDGASAGTLLLSAVVSHLGGAAGPVEIDDAEVDPDLWETPTFSSSGESLEVSGQGLAGLYVWIAGESAIVTGLRRLLVNDVGVDRRQVAFMGYWRRGVAMRS